MSYSEDYPKLYEKYPFDNFEVIMEALDKHLCDLFQLGALETLVNAEGEAGSYLAMFDHFMREFQHIYTAEEVVAKFYELIRENQEIGRELTTHYIFVPDGESSPHQIGFLEKLAMGRLRVGEPLTFIDMLRGVHGIMKLKRFDPSVSVVHLRHLPKPLSPFMNEPAPKMRVFLNGKEALLINFNVDVNGDPKWGVLDLRSDPPRIYCEMALTEQEKFDVQCCMARQDIQFIGGTSASLPSTGYTAFAWLDTEITHAWAFDTKADFSALLKNFTFVQFGGDHNTSTHYQVKEEERNAFCTEGYKYIFSQGYSDRTEGYKTTAIAYASALGSIDGVSYKPGDMSAVVKIVGETGKLSFDKLETYRWESSRTLPTSFDQTMISYEENGKHVLTVDETHESITLTVPASLSPARLVAAHERQCLASGTQAYMYVDLHNRLPHNPTSPGAYDAWVMVFTLSVFVNGVVTSRLRFIASS